MRKERKKEYGEINKWKKGIEIEKYKKRERRNESEARMRANRKKNDEGRGERMKGRDVR